MAKDGKVKEREIWVDTIRGLTILMVIFHHSLQASSQITYIPGRLFWLDWIGDHFWMPAFLFCSGLFYRSKLSKPWAVTLESRVLFCVWLILVWSLFSWAAETAGLDLYPWGLTSDTSTLRQGLGIFFPPYGILWFVWAILIMSVFARLIVALALPLQVLATLGVMVALSYWHDSPQTAGSFEFLLYNLLHHAVPYFMLGVWLSRPVLTYFTRPSRALAPLAAGLVLTGLLLALSGPEFPLKSYFLAFALTLGYISATRLIAEIPWIGQTLAIIGALSLQVYLIHEFFVALIFAGVASAGLTLSPLVTLAVIASLASVVTIALSVLNAKFGPRWLFATPRWLTRQIFGQRFTSVKQT
ncbi:acyltransferase [Celeribacter sp. PS-C1]|uniref:acyltransferase family protein n=1 Tax=Celeribacter sp. PS-C1 TaxID=2820813 RepID=UPI001C66BD9D|nr:acyltransferase [Celeribacter sp. PS-C1]MBW6418172.1 acyltransferase [Celeribacter sp. PS-C1]